MDPEFTDVELQNLISLPVDASSTVAVTLARLARQLLAKRDEVEKLGERMSAIFAAFDDARPYVSGIGGAGRIEDEARAVVATLKATATELEAARADKAARASAPPVPVLGIDRARVLAAIEARTPAAVNFQADAVAGAMRALYAVIAEIPEGPGTALAIRLKGWERDQVIAWARAVERAGAKNARRNEWLAALALLDIIDGARDHAAVPCHSGTNGEDHDGPIRDWRCVRCGEEIVGPDPKPCTRPHEAALERVRAPTLTASERQLAINVAQATLRDDRRELYDAHHVMLAKALLDVDEERALLGATKLWKDEDPEGFTAHTINAVQREMLNRCANWIGRKTSATRSRIVAELRRAEPELVDGFQAKPPGREAVAYAAAIKTGATVVTQAQAKRATKRKRAKPWSARRTGAPAGNKRRAR